MNRHIRSLGRIAAMAGLMGVLASGFVGCEELPEEEQAEKPYYPTVMAGPEDFLSATNDLFFSTNYVGISNFGIHPRSLYDAHWLEGVNGFSIYENHVGGWGNTYEINSRESGIYMKWVGGVINEIAVSSPFQGEIIESGVRVGDSIDKFLVAYPNAARGNTGLSYWYWDNTWHQKLNRNQECFSAPILVSTITNEADVIRKYMCIVADMAGDRIGRLRIKKSYNDPYAFDYEGP